MRSSCLGAAMITLVERLWLGAAGSLYASGQLARYRVPVAQAASM